MAPIHAPNTTSTVFRLSTLHAATPQRLAASFVASRRLASSNRPSSGPLSEKEPQKLDKESPKSSSTNAAENVDDRSRNTKSGAQPRINTEDKAKYDDADVKKHNEELDNRKEKSHHGL